MVSPPQQSFIARVLSLPHVEGYVHHLTNLIDAAPNLASVTREQVQELRDAYKLKNSRTADLRVFSALWEGAHADEVSDVTLTGPRSIIDVLGLKPAQALMQLGRAVIRRQFEQAVSDENKVLRGNGALVALANAYGLDQPDVDRLMKEIIAPAYKVAFDKATENGMLSPADEQRLDAMCGRLGIEVRSTPQDREAREVLRTMWRIHNEALEPIQTRYTLQKAEVAYRAARARLLETRTRTVSTGYSGTSVSIPIMRGIRYRVSSGSVSRRQEKYTHVVGEGEVVLTNKRLLFVSADRSIATAFTQIVGIEPYSDGIGVVKANGKPQLFAFSKPDPVFAPMVQRAMQDARTA